MRQDSKNPAQGMHQDEIALDGVRYANLHQAGQQWRIGAVSPAWRQELLALPVNPDSNDLARLEDRGRSHARRNLVGRKSQRRIPTL